MIAGVHTVDEMLALDADGIRARVVSLVRGPRAIDGRSPEYLEGLFDALVEDPRATRPLVAKPH
ncbi:MAG: hypothetical protein VYB93_05735 [Pseudomonadota bacterium]|nr:hypothetical protein [Pseudomonadota bacterium]